MALTRRGTLKRLPRHRRAELRREEFNHLIDLLNERGEVINTVLRDLDIQFKRIAQLQAEVDALRKTLEKIIPL